jgi:hypothetical protein
MTNFEKWKQTLSAEEIRTNYGILSFCPGQCPAADFCKGGKYRNRNKPECKTIFHEWANAEAEE